MVSRPPGLSYFRQHDEREAAAVRRTTSGVDQTIFSAGNFAWSTGVGLTYRPTQCALGRSSTSAFASDATPARTTRTIVR